MLSHPQPLPFPLRKLEPLHPPHADKINKINKILLQLLLLSQEQLEPQFVAVKSLMVKPPQICCLQFNNMGQGLFGLHV